MWSKAREICIMLCLERTWQRGCLLKKCNHGKELGSILTRHWIKKKNWLWRLHDFGVWGLIAYSKSSTTESEFTKLRLRMPVSLDTCERKPYPKRKSCGFKNIRIRVEGASIELTRHRNEMPNRMISSCHCGRWFVIYLTCLVLPCIAICKWTEILVHIGYFSHLALGTQRRFPPKYIENNF